MNKYNPKKIEKKWQEYWEKNKSFAVKEDPAKKKFYGLVEFPYPSGAGLHVGHPRSYTAMDVISRKRRMEGYNVLYPIGFDSFGLPTENFAIKTGRPPEEITAENIATFTRQLKSLGFSFDWERAVTTSAPEYYRWTQWIFLQLFKRGLAYKKNQPINWCPNDKIGLANEEVVDGKCERCGTAVEKRNKEQWMLAITKYADSLLQGLKEVDYIERAKVQQENWIGRSEGAEIDFQISQDTKKVNYLILHGRNGAPDSHAFPWFKAQLESKDYKVQVPVLPNTEEPNDEEQAGFVLKNCQIDENTIIIGHSFGGIVALRLLEKGIKAKQVILLCTPYSGEFLDKKSRPSVTEACQKGFDFETIKANANSFKLIYDSSDYVVPISDGDAFAENLDLGYLIKLKGQEPHFSGNTEPEVMKEFLPYLRVFTTRPDTLFGATYMVVAPEHDIIKKMHAEIENWSEVEKYIEASKKKSDLERTELQKEKSGVELKGIKAVNPVTGSEIPVWVADYVLGGYGTGAIMAVPAHDERDWEFAKKYNLSIKQVLRGGNVEEAAYTEDGEHMSSDFLDGLNKVDAMKKMIAWLEEKGIGTKKVQFKLRDWVFSRQRYWGEPIPLVFCEKCNGWIPLPEDQLPLELPKVEKYQPTDTGESPLSTVTDWVNTACPRCGGPARRETDTMPNWAGSSWYFLRYLDPKNDKELASKEAMEYWMPIDWYNGGMEHTVLHLLYSRFWNQFLYDIGIAPTKEPYQKRTSHGMILAKGGEKMSKSRGNVVNPDEMVEEFGADALRTYIMFMGPFDQAVEWDTNGLIGVRRFFDRVWNLQEKVTAKTVILSEAEQSEAKSKDPIEYEKTRLNSLIHQTIKKISEDIEAMRFNTAVAKLMELSNEMNKEEAISSIQFKIFVKLLSPFAPHLCEELWEVWGSKESIAFAPWPEYREELAKENEITIAIQINGKVRDELAVPVEITEAEVKKLSLEREKIVKWLEGKEPKKVIYVKGKLVSIVV